MFRPLLLSVLIPGLLAGLPIETSAVPPSQQQIVHIDEAGARATLAGDSIRVVLPFKAPAAEPLKATARLLSPTDSALPADTQTVAPGAQTVEFHLARPRDSHGKVIENIEWYRISYNIQAPSVPALHGILTVGAITSNLFHFSLAEPSGSLTPGSPLTLRVYTGNPVTRTAVRGVRVTARLQIVIPGREKTQELEETKVVNHAGETFFTFPIPDILGISATLQLRGELRGKGNDVATSTFQSEFDAQTAARIAVQKDKPLYQPGQTVHLRALIFDAGHHAAEHVPVTLTIENSDNKKILAQTLTTSRFGIVSYDWKLSPQTETDVYSVEVQPAKDSILDGEGYAQVTVKRYDLPQFTVSAKLDRGYYLEGQTPAVTIHAGYLFGRPVAGGEARIERDPDSVTQGADRTEKAEPEAKAVLDTQGNAVFHPDLAKAFEQFKGEYYSHFRDLAYRAYVTDPTTGRTEPRKFTIRISRKPIHIYLSNLSGNGSEGEYLVTTTYADGIPAICKVTLDLVRKGQPADRIAVVSTSRYGLAKVHLHFPSGSGSFHPLEVRARAEDAHGLRGSLDDTEYAYSTPHGLWIEMEKSLLAPGEPIRAIVHGTDDQLVDLDVLGGNKTLVHQTVHLSNGKAEVLIPSDERFHGVVTLVAYTLSDLNQSSYMQTSQASVLYPEDKSLRIKLTGIQPEYEPGSPVRASLRVTDPKGAVPAAIAIGVTDTAVDDRARTEEDFEENPWSWGWGDVYGQYRAIAGFTLDDLNRTDMSHPVPEDMQLLAEALLGYRYGSGVSVEGVDNQTALNQYESTMANALKPLGKALLAAKSEHLSADLGLIRKVAARAGLAVSILIDPWDVPYRSKVTVEGDDEVLSFVSAGPDKRFGDEDDFTIEVARQSVFARTGERLQVLLDSAIEHGEPLPGTESRLIAFAKRHGLDLDKVRDPQGRPFVYEVHVKRRWYSISVSLPRRGQDSGEPSYLAYQNNIWNSPQYNYFASESKRLQAAIRAWEDSAHSFPTTEQQARQAFAAAGIRFDDLRDPTGAPFAIKAEEVTAFTRRRTVEAGKTISTSEKTVTLKMRAVEILRTASEDKATLPEMVDEVLEPYMEQSGSDLKPRTVVSGTFRGNTGAVGGTVTDQTGAVIPKATVTVKDSTGRFSESAKSDASGWFVIGDLKPGFYSMQVNALGFMLMELRGIEVSSASLTTVNVTLRVGAVAQTVEVSSPPPVPLNTEASVTVMAAGMGPAKDRVEAGAKRIIRTPAGTATVIPPGITPRLRHVFEETAYWTPSLETDASGRASIHFTLPDSLTTWKLHAFASTVDGRVRELSTNFLTFQSFFVDLDVPQVLTAGDELTLPVNLRNYTRSVQSLPVTIADQPWMQVLTARVVQTRAPAGGTAKVHFGLRAAHVVDKGPLRVSASNRTVGDAVEKEVRVHPDGEPRHLASTALLHDTSSRMEMDLPQSVIPGSLHARLRIYPNLAMHIVESMNALIEQPNGCAEQTISSAYPSLLLLRLAKETGKPSPQSGRAKQYLRQGYERLLDYYDASGGFTYWGGSDHTPDAALTAYSLEFLSDAAPFIPIRLATVTAARKWLLDTQQTDGSWKPSYGQADPKSTLYIALQLQRSLPAGASRAERDRTEHAVSRALAWAQSFVSAVHDPYVNALRLEIAVLRKLPAEQKKFVAELAGTTHRDRKGVHWQVDGILPFYTWGYAGSVETSAVVVRALIAAQASGAARNVIDSVLQYLIENEDAGGIWYSGQTTTRVLKALLPFAVEQLKAQGTQSPLDIRINGVPLSASDARALQPVPGLLDAPRTIDATAYLRPGRNEVEFTSGSSAQLVSAQLSTFFYVPWQPQQHPGVEPGKDYGLNFSYTCLSPTVKLGKPVTCDVHARRFGSAGYGMLLAEAGLPPGADVDRAQLTKMVLDGTIDRYEIAPDHIVFYLWSSNPAGTQFTFQFTPRYAIHAKTAPSVLYDYYNPDERVVLEPQSFTVSGDSAAVTH